MFRRFAGWLLDLLSLECGDPRCDLCNRTGEALLSAGHKDD